MKIYVDGGCRGNPGPGAWAVILDPAKGEGFGDYSAATTNNRMEYEAMLHALQWVLDNQPQERIRIHSDSKLIVSQITGGWKVKDDVMRLLCNHCRDLIHALSKNGTDVKIQYVPRSENKQADRLVNRILDAHEHDRNSLPQMRA